MPTTDRLTVVLVHGFMDDSAIWSATRSQLTANVDIVAVDLAGGSGDPSAAGPFTLQRFVDDVTAAVDAVEGPVVLVGHSMGTQISELAAAQRSDVVRGLVLLTPIPLAGMHMPAEFADGMKALPLAPVEHQRAARLGLSANFPTDELDRLITAGGVVPPSTVSDVLDVWNDGTPQGQQPSDYSGPVLIIPGAADPFATAELIAGGVSSRFTDVEVLPVPGAGHWPHVEAPTFVAAHLDAFIASRVTSRAQPSSVGEA